MSLADWLAGLLRRRPTQAPCGERLLERARFLVLDVEVTGTDIRRDRMTAIAALPVVAGAYRLSDLVRYGVPRTKRPSSEPPDGSSEALNTLRALVAESVLVTINPRFVKEMIGRSRRTRRLACATADWLDLAAVARVVNGERHDYADVDRWVTKMRTEGPAPHDAVHDVVVMAQMLLALLAYLDEAEILTLDSLARIQESAMWLRNGSLPVGTAG